VAIESRRVTFMSAIPVCMRILRLLVQKKDYNKA
jgi:hypothetical protein